MTLDHEEFQGQEIIRVAVEGGPYIGFIEVNLSTTLTEARTLIVENLDGAPQDFKFLLQDGIPVSLRQENFQNAMMLYPTIFIRENKRKVLRTDKALVTSMQGEQFITWISDGYTFGQLRQDASLYWSFQPETVVLEDKDGFLWPESAPILSVLSDEQLASTPSMFLRYKSGQFTEIPRSVNLPSQIPKDSKRPPVLIIDNNLFLQKNNSTGPSFQPERNGLFTPNTRKTGISRGPLSPLSISMGEDPHTVDDDRGRIEQADDHQLLWHIFTYYCVQGDTSELARMRQHQFLRCIRDCRLLGDILNPPIVEIIYASEVKGRPGKMTFAEFINALVRVAMYIYDNNFFSNESMDINLYDSVETKTEKIATYKEQLLSKLLLTSIFPHANRWKVELWESNIEVFQNKEIRRIISRFEYAFAQIFYFYAGSVKKDSTKAYEALSFFHDIINSSPRASKENRQVRGSLERSFSQRKRRGMADSKPPSELSMDYIEFRKFMLDFSFSKLQLTAREYPQFFLAGCYFKTAVREPHDGGDSYLGTSNRKQTFFPSESQLEWKGTQLTFQCFLQVLIHISITSFSYRYEHMSPLQCIKALFQHFHRSLTHSRIEKIIHNRQSLTKHEQSFHAGTILFNVRFVNMWRKDGKPDYLHHATTTSKSLYPVMSSGMKLLEGVASSKAHTKARFFADGSDTPENYTSKKFCSPRNGSPPSHPKRRLNGSSPTTSFDRQTDLPLKESPKPIISTDQSTDYAEYFTESTSKFDQVSTGESVYDCAMQETQNYLVDVVPMKESTETEDEKLDSHSPPRGAGIGVMPWNRMESLEEDSALTFGETSKEIVGVGILESQGSYSSRIGREGEYFSEWGDSRIDRSDSIEEESASIVPMSSNPVESLRPQVKDPNFGHQVEQKLLKGDVFRKFSSWGPSHRKYVWCTQGLEDIMWRSVNTKKAIGKGREKIAVAEILEVLAGESPKNKSAFLKPYASNGAALRRCFSIVGRDKRLDLEADSEGSRDEWVAAFTYLIQTFRSKRIVG